jgi:Kef-type K+ transport system membrane component KefB
VPHLAPLLLDLAVIWLAARLLGEAAERLGQPAVLGELLAGIVVGPAVLGLVRGGEVLMVLAELGVIVLLFEIGLESDLDELLKAGPQAMLVALVGIACPFAAGYVLAAWWGSSTLQAVFVGASLTATSVGITARVLRDLGRLREAAAKVILGAAVIDDVLGLVILAVISGIVTAGSVSLSGVALLLTKIVAFLAVALGIGIRIVPGIVRHVQAMRVRGQLIGVALAFCLALAALAEVGGLATIIGAFAAGLVLARSEPRARIADVLAPVADVLVPIFFVTVGMRVDLAALDPGAPGGLAAIALAAILSLLAVVSKLAAGLAVFQRGVSRWAVGVGMIPRGEVGLIFAGIGLANGVIDAGLYAALVAMVMVSTFVVPPWLRAIYGRSTLRA